MFRRFAIAAVLALSIGPALAAEQVQGNSVPTASPQGQAATASNKAVVEKNIAGTTATITVPASSEPQEFHIDIKPLIDGLLPYIVSTIGGIIVLIGGLLTVWLKQKFNIDIDQKHRDAWQQSAQNAAGALLARGAVKIEESGKISVQSEAMASVVNTVMERVPDAIKHFGFTPNDIQNLIVAKIPQVVTGSVPATVAPAPDMAGAAAAAKA